MSDFDQTRVMGTPTMAGATMQMPAGGTDAFRTQMGGTATCPVCQSSTPLAELYCGECGFLLTSTLAEAVAVPVESAPIAELVDVADGRRYRLKPGVNTVGRMGTDVLVNESTVSRTHAKIHVENGTIQVEDLGSSNGTKVGDRRLNSGETAVAMAGMPLKFGNWRVMLEASGMLSAEPTIAVPTTDRTLMEPVSALPDATVPGTNTEPVLPAAPETVSESDLEAVAKLQVASGPSGDIMLPEGMVTIGRKPGNTVVISNDTYVSSRHAEIVTDTNGTYLTDLGSTNGTVVNGQKLAPNEKQLLLEGDDIQLGQSRFTFVFIEPPADTLTEYTGETSINNGVERGDVEFTPESPIAPEGTTPAQSVFE